MITNKDFDGNIEIFPKVKTGLYSYKSEIVKVLNS